jgi:hypothetical protein
LPGCTDGGFKTNTNTNTNGNEWLDGGVDASEGTDAAQGADAAYDTDGGETPDGGADQCPYDDGVTWQGKTRFMYGVNYAWYHFAGDFGGLSAWGNPGVAAAEATHRANLAEMRDHGVSVIRWWVFPDFRGDGVIFDGNDLPTGLSAGAVADVRKALELAELEDVYLMLCIFSFDGFFPSEEIAGVWTPGIEPMVTGAQARHFLLENVVRPLAQAVESSPYEHRMIAWDVINEPEWAITGSSLYGDADFEPMTGIDAVSHAVMESFIADTITVLRSESSALMTVGGAAFKWSNAWIGLDLDFHQFHMYEWINTWWPYTDPPSAHGLDDKPVVMGEFPMGDLTLQDSYSDVVSAWFTNGYGGALSWQYIDADGGALDLVAAFGADHPCQTSY